MKIENKINKQNELVEITVTQNEATLDPITKRIGDLELYPSTKIAFNQITKPKTRVEVAQMSIQCENEANRLMASIEKIKGVKDIQEELLCKGEEGVDVPPLPIVEMKVVDAKSNRVTNVVYGLEASMTNHRVIFLDVDITSTPQLVAKNVEKNSFLGSQKNIEVSHQITSSFTYIPVCYSDILGISCDIQNGIKSRYLLQDQKLWYLGIIPLALALVLAFAVNWYLLFLGVLAIPFYFFSRTIKQTLPPERTQIKVLRLAVLNPDNKQISIFELYIPQIYSIQALLLWIKEIQFRSPSLQHVSDLNKNLNVNVG